MKTEYESDIDLTIYTTVCTNGDTQWRKAIDDDPSEGLYHICNYNTGLWETYFTYDEAKSAADRLKVHHIESDFSRVLPYLPNFFDDEFWE